MDSNKTNRMIYQTDETRDKILGAAEEMFIRKGLYETRMKDLAEAIGISRTSLYRYFRDKLDLSLAIVALRIDEGKDRDILMTLIESQPDSISKIEALLKKRFLAPESIDTYRFLAEFDAYYSGSRIPEGFREKMEAALSFDRKDDLLLQVLERGQEDGSIRSDMEPRMMHEILLNAVRSLHQRLILRGSILVEIDQADFDHIMDEFMKILMQGIRRIG